MRMSRCPSKHTPGGCRRIACLQGRLGPMAVRHTGTATLWRYDRPVKYQERATPVIGAVLWQRKLDSAPVGTPIMPDGCLDLLWDGNRLFVAGPDTAARWHQSPAGTTYVALRFSGGLGPTLLGVPADDRAGSDSEPRRAVARAPGPGPDRAGRGRSRGGVGSVGGKARCSLRSGSARTACPGHGKGGDANRRNGRAACASARANFTDDASQRKGGFQFAHSRHQNVLAGP